MLKAPKSAPEREPVHHLWRREQAMWTSGRDGGQAEAAAGAITILPYPDGIMQGDEIHAHPPVSTGWRTVEMDNRTETFSGDVAILAYRVCAEKADAPIYHALCASTWLHDAGSWLRISHQHTPIA